jgi:hypothetical protein
MDNSYYMDRLSSCFLDYLDDLFQKESEEVFGFLESERKEKDFQREKIPRIRGKAWEKCVGFTAREMGGRHPHVRSMKRLRRRAIRRIGKELLQEALAA